MNIIDKLETKSLREIPPFKSGDTVAVSYKIKEGSIVVTYASSDSDAQKAANLLVKRGLAEVFYLEGGINSWLENNMPLSGER